MNEMEFILVSPNKPWAVFGNMWMVFGNGSIDLETGAHLTKLVTDNAIPGRSILYLNSPGGNTVGGMKLGRAIRAAGLFTYIGQAGVEEAIGEFRYRKSEPGGCYSAGALAFLGGVHRWIDDKSEYGVHRFYADADPGSDVAQRLSSQIVDYISEMGADPALFSEMTKAGRDEINVLSAERLRHLGVTNGGLNKTAWTIESVGEGGLYFKGERVTWRGVKQVHHHGWFQRNHAAIRCSIPREEAKRPFKCALIRYWWMMKLFPIDIPRVHK